MNDNDHIEFQKELIEKILPLDALPNEIKEDILDYIIFRRELTKESDRGCALLAASHLDFLLENLLKVKLIGTAKQLKALLDFNGPLGSFSSRIQISYSIGLITPYCLNDLQLIRKIRNEFGHSPSIINFDNQNIRSLCNALKLTARSNNTPKSKFIASVSFISGALFSMTVKENKFQEKPELDIEKANHFSDVAVKMLKAMLKISDDS